jgi:hypothetical protein
VQAYDDELIFADDRNFTNEEIYEDEDDSNDEDNWRNDYPDEDPHFYENEDAENYYGDGMNILSLLVLLQYSQRHSVINHCDRRITHLDDLDISFVLLKISSTFLLHLECYFISPKRHIK